MRELRPENGGVLVTPPGLDRRARGAAELPIPKRMRRP
jgi:hypothetical protein